MSNEFFNNNENDERIIDVQATMSDMEPKKKKKSRRGFAKLVASALAFGLIAGASFQGYNAVTSHYNNPTNVVTSDTSKVGEASTDTGNLTDSGTAVETSTTQNGVTSDVSSVVENVMPSIVAINSTMNEVSSDFFGRQYNQEVEGSGSGIIIGQTNSEILIATNNHVVEGATSVEIVFADDTKAPATVKGTAPGSDLAVVSVNISDLADGTIGNIKIATLGDSTTLKLGEMAIAIGNALGYGQSITVGYISALNREVTVNDVTLNLIQTDAAINPGNSGGALLNSKGEVIGINSVKYVDDNVESIGYAIPISDAIPVINELMNRTTLDDSDKAYLGISGKDVTSAYSESFNMPVGIYVGEVQDGYAAQEAGIQTGDIIVGVNNVKVETMEELQDALNYIKAGSTGTIQVKTLDNGQYVDKKLDITFGKRPASK